MDHFARRDDPLSVALRNGTLHRNFQGYTTHAEADLVGFGVSAISHVGDTFTQNFRELPLYEASIRDGQLPVTRGYVMRGEDRLRSTIIEKLLCHARLVKSEIEDEFGLDFDEFFAPELARLLAFEADGMVQGVRSPRIEVTPTGRIFIRTIAQVFDAFESAAVASKAV